MNTFGYDLIGIMTYLGIKRHLGELWIAISSEILDRWQCNVVNSLSKIKKALIDT